MGNIRAINLILLVFYIIYYIYLIDIVLITLTTPNPFLGLVILTLLPIYVGMFLIFLLVILHLLKSAILGTVDKDYIFSVSVFLVCFIIIAYNLLSLDWSITPKIIGILIILLSIYKIYVERLLINKEEKSMRNDNDFTQKIKNYYNNYNTLSNLIFSGFLILGFLAFALLSLGGILVGDLIFLLVFAVASFILVIGGYLFYLMWFKK